MKVHIFVQSLQKSFPDFIAALRCRVSKGDDPPAPGLFQQGMEGSMSLRTHARGFSISSATFAILKSLASHPPQRRSQHDD
jgi:hypothetical protein